jgi:chitodextrinase
VQSKLVDANPGTSTFADAALGVGSSVTDPLTGVLIRTTSVGPAGAMVLIQFPGGDSEAPSAPGWLPATPTESYVRLNRSAATDNVGVTGYRVYRDGVQVGTTTELTYVDVGLAPLTTYQYEIRAYDASTNLGPGVSGAVRTAGPAGLQPPTVPTSLKVTVQNGRQVRLTWKASSDDTGVAVYEVLRNGVEVGETRATFYVDRPGRGRFTYRVRARDVDGNLSPLSAAVAVTL